MSVAVCVWGGAVGCRAGRRCLRSQIAICNRLTGRRMREEDRWRSAERRITAREEELPRSPGTSRHKETERKDLMEAS